MEIGLEREASFGFFSRELGLGFDRDRNLIDLGIERLIFLLSFFCYLFGTNKGIYGVVFIVFLPSGKSVYVCISISYFRIVKGFAFMSLILHDIEFVSLNVLFLYSLATLTV